MSKKVKFLTILISLTAFISTTSFSTSAMENQNYRETTFLSFLGCEKNPPKYLSLSNFRKKDKKIEKTNIKTLKKEQYKKLEKALANLNFKEIINNISNMNNIKNIANNYSGYYDAFEELLKSKKIYEENLENLCKSKKIDLKDKKENQTENIKDKTKKIIKDEIEKQKDYILKELKEFFSNPKTIENISNYFNIILCEMNSNKENNKTILINKYKNFRRQLSTLLDEIFNEIKNNQEKEIFKTIVNTYSEIINTYEEKLKKIEEDSSSQENINKENEELEKTLKECEMNIKNIENLIKNYEDAINKNDNELIKTCEKDFEKLNKTIKKYIENFVTFNESLNSNLLKRDCRIKIDGLNRQIDILNYVYESLTTKKALISSFETMKDVFNSYKDAINKNDTTAKSSCEETFKNIYETIKLDMKNFTLHRNGVLDLNNSQKTTIKKIDELITTINKLNREFNELKSNKDGNLDKNPKQLKDENLNENENLKLKNNLESCYKNMDNLVKDYENAINKNNNELIDVCEKEFENLFSNIKPDIDICSKKNLGSKSKFKKSRIENEIVDLKQKIGFLKLNYDGLKRNKKNISNRKENNLKTPEKNKSEKNPKQIKNETLDENTKLLQNLQSQFEIMTDSINSYRSEIKNNDTKIISHHEETFESLYNFIKPDIDEFESNNPLVLDLSNKDDKNDKVSKIRGLIRKIENLKLEYDYLKTTKKNNKQNNELSSDEEKDPYQNNREIIIENVQFRDFYDFYNDTQNQNNDREILGYWKYLGM